MDKKKALSIIDEWANFYFRILGEADNLDLIEKDVYTILRTKDEKWASIFNIRLEHLENNDLIKAVNEIKEIKQHIWWNLSNSDKINKIIGRREPTPDDDEVYAVMTTDEMPLYQDSIINIKKAESIYDFKIFNNICFDKTLSSENLINEYIKMGFNTIVCQTAIKESFKEEAKVITIRAAATYEGSKNLGKKLGFKYI